MAIGASVDGLADHFDGGGNRMRDVLGSLALLVAALCLAVTTVLLATPKLRDRVA